MNVTAFAITMAVAEDVDENMSVMDGLVLLAMKLFMTASEPAGFVRKGRVVAGDE